MEYLPEFATVALVHYYAEKLMGAILIALGMTSSPPTEGRGFLSGKRIVFSYLLQTKSSFAYPHLWKGGVFAGAKIKLATATTK